MIVNFRISNFLSIREEVLLSFEADNSKDLEEYYVCNVGEQKDYRLLKLGIIYGANSSGKTNVLNGLDFLRNMVLKPLEKKTDEFVFEPFLFDKDSNSKNTSFSLEFIQNGIKYLYSVVINKTTVLNEALYFFKPNKALVFKRVTEEDKRLSKIELGSKVRIPKDQKTILEANTLSNNTVLGGYLKKNIDFGELNDVTDWFKRKLKPMITPYPINNLFSFVTHGIENNEINRDNVLKILKKADFNISDIVIKNDNLEISADVAQILSKLSSSHSDDRVNFSRNGIQRKRLEFIHSFGEGKEYRLDYQAESAGTKRYYQFGGLLDLLIRKETIFLIDELESSLHPDLFKHFLLTFLANSHNSQIIATTHQREFLMERDLFRNDILWFTEKTESGNTDLFSLTDFDTSVIRNTSSVYNAYKIGKLGANPELEDYYLDL